MLINFVGHSTDEEDYIRIAAEDNVNNLVFDDTERRCCFSVQIISDGKFENTENFMINLVFSPFFSIPSAVVLEPNVTTIEILGDAGKSSIPP